jgi:acyl phosphate:glycerol-3-phosphate acyltransferase
MAIIIIFFISAYIAGSINFAITLFKITGKGDPRKKFSENAGTTNVYRQAGKFWAVIVFLLDTGRAIGIAFLSVYLLKVEFVPLIGLALVLGNRYPCFHNFRGGKGVANYLGFTAVLSPLWAGIAAAAWLLAYMIVRIPFIASFFMIAFLVAGTIIINDCNPVSFTFAIVTGMFIIYNHKKNIIEYSNKETKNEKILQDK